MRQRAIRKRTDFGTVVLHWLLVVTLLTAVATGLSIASDEPGSAWLLAFGPLLPKATVWTAHMPAALVLMALATGYVTYVIKARLFNRVQLDRVRVAGLLAAGQARWSAVNVVLYWIFFAAMAAEFVTGLQLYLGRATDLVVQIHLIGTWVILAYPAAHVAVQWAIGGAPQLLRIIRPARLSAPPPPFDPLELVASLHTQLAHAKASKSRHPKRPSRPAETPVARDSRRIEAAPPAALRGTPRTRRSTVQANPFVVALAVAISTIAVVLPAERATQDRLYIRKIAAADRPILDGDSSDAVWQSVKPLTVWTVFGGNFDGTGETRIEVRAVHDGERVYFCFIWDDPTRSLKHLPLMKRADGWHVLQDHYDIADAHAFFEDKFAVLLTQLDVTVPGDRTFHIGPRPLADKPATLSSRGLHYTMSPKVVVEVWQWKATSGGPDWVEQDHFAMPAGPTPVQVSGGAPYRGGFVEDPRAAALRTTNFDEQPAGGYAHALPPRRLPRNWQATMTALGHIDLDPDHSESDGSRWSMTEAESEPYSAERDAQIPVGVVIPGVLVARPPETGFPEVRGSARWAAGRWTLEMSRRRTGDAETVPIGNGTYMRVSAFDHAQTHHTRHLRPILVEMEDGE